MTTLNDKLPAFLATDQVRFEETRDRAFPGEQRQPVGAVGVFLTLCCVGLAVFTLWQALVAPIPAIPLRATHLAVAIPLIFLLYPVSPSRDSRSPSIFDWALAVLGSAAFLWVIYSYDRFQA